ncbi:MAG: CDP-alcohol phosphatidyltransferase family protein [Prevotellaceae bacterium]|jgi:phosphatidylglycerophosphate synthase|nr:CDP-alcohol phosphatidyltransferase family protein [Prevotellaceae bacterium]
MTARERAQQLIYLIIDPFVRLLIRCGVTPNGVTTIGLLLNIGAAVLFVVGAPAYKSGRLGYITAGGFVILFAGLFDMLDGQVARIGKMSSKFGAMYDSVLDRYSELIVLSAITYYFMYNQLFIGGLITLLTLVGSIMVSYVRARAEGLGVECKGGLMQRPERVVLTGVGALACGISSYWITESYVSMWLFVGVLALVGLLSNLTAIGRLNRSRRSMQRKEETHAE